MSLTPLSYRVSPKDKKRSRNGVGNFFCRSPSLLGALHGVNQSKGCQRQSGLGDKAFPGAGPWPLQDRGTKSGLSLEICLKTCPLRTLISAKCRNEVYNGGLKSNFSSSCVWEHRPEQLQHCCLTYRKLEIAPDRPPVESGASDDTPEHVFSKELCKLRSSHFLFLFMDVLHGNKTWAGRLNPSSLLSHKQQAVE